MMTRRRHPPFQGRTTVEHSPPKARPDQATRLAMKEERERDAVRAMQEYQSEKQAVVANAERLRALRLAKEAGGEAIAKTPKPARKKH